MKRFFLLSSGVALFYLICEWGWISSGYPALSQIDINRTLLALAVAGLMIGLASGIFCATFSKLLTAERSALAFPLGVLAFLEMFALQNATLTGTAIVSSLACGSLVFIVVYGAIPRLRANWTEFSLWWIAALGGFCLTLALSTSRAFDSIGFSTALIVAAISAFLAVSGFRSRARGFLLTGTGFVVLLAGSAIIVFHYPLITAESPADADRPSVLLFTIDTLRADHVGAYGYAKARTPNLDALAERGVLFKHAVTANVFTGPSHTSILTGLLSRNHGVVKNRMRIPVGVQTIAEQLQKQGYLTAAFVSSYTTEDSASGLPSRFQYFNDDIRAFRWLPKAGFKVPVLTFFEKFIKVTGWHEGDFDQAYRQAKVTSDLVVEWFKHNGTQPYFLWVHFFDPHIPYQPPEPYLEASKSRSMVSGDWYYLKPREKAEIVNSPERIAAMIDLYDAEIAYADHELGRVLEAARKHTRNGNPIVIAAADHGESMGEHNIYWDRELYDPTALVPLIIQAPERFGYPAHRVEAQVRLIDIAPTILDLLGLESSRSFDGQSLVGLLQGTNSESTGPAISEKFPIKAVFPAMRSVRTDQWKYLQRYPGWKGEVPRSEAEKELYHLPLDTREEVNLIESGSDVPEGFDALLQAQTRMEESEEMDLSPEDRERLRSLGYIQ